MKKKKDYFAEDDKTIQNKSKEFYLSYFPLHSKIFHTQK